MRVTLSPVLFVLSAGLPAAQVQLRVFAHTDLIVVDQRIPAGTNISGGAALTWTNQHPTLPEHARMAVTVAPAAVHFTNWVYAFASSPPAIGLHSIRVHLTSPAPVSGTLRAEGLASGGSVFQVDVRNDGSHELTRTLAASPDVYEETLTITAAGVDVVIGASASSSGLGSYSGDSSIRLSFSPTGTNVSRSGDPCGAELTARYWELPVLWTLNRRYELAAANTPVTPFAFFVLGTTPQNVVIPPLGCVLRTDIVVPLPTTIDPNGRASVTLPVPENLTAFEVLAQFLAATLDAQQNPIWRTSELARLRLGTHR